MKSLSLIFFATALSAQPPLEAWKAAVVAGDAPALARLYSTDPPATAIVGKAKINLDDEVRFWAGLKTSGVSGINPRILETVSSQGSTKVILRISAVKTDDAQKIMAGMAQIWAQTPSGWRIVATSRAEFTPEATRVLPQPAVPNTALYSDPGEAAGELKTALSTAAKEHKRVIVVFGGNWCYDCHVLDTTFHSKEFAPLVDHNYVVLHINVGDEGKDNNDLAARLGVALDHGVPALGVLDPDGTVVYAQKNGEFESTVKIGPAEVREFLMKWKPRKDPKAAG